MGVSDWSGLVAGWMVGFEMGMDYGFWRNDGFGKDFFLIIII